MAKLSYKVSYYVMYAIFAVIIIVLALFYGVGYTNPWGEYNAPEHTDTLIYLMYILFGIAVLATVAAAIAQFIAAFRDNAKNALKSLIGFVLLIVLVLVTYAMGSDAPVKTGDGIYDDAFWLKITDMFLYSTYFLLGIAVLATLINLTGIFRKR